MKTEIILVEDINAKTSGMSCFEARFEHQAKAINNCKRVTGICIIENETYKFSFNPYFMDGDVIKINDQQSTAYMSLVKGLVVDFVYFHKDLFMKTNHDMNTSPARLLAEFKGKFEQNQATGSAPSAKTLLSRHESEIDKLKKIIDKDEKKKASVIDELI